MALLLGAPSLSALPPKRQVVDTPGRTCEGGHTRVEELRDRLRDGVGWLLGTGDGAGDEDEVEDRHSDGTKGGVDEVVLRALVEVVRVCEAGANS